MFKQINPEFTRPLSARPLLLFTCETGFLYNLKESNKSFYNNCLISRALIGSFLSSIRVQTDKILIYASLQVELSAVKVSTF